MFQGWSEKPPVPASSVVGSAVPFVIKPHPQKRAVVHFGVYVDHPQGYEEPLLELLEKTDKVALDFRKTHVMVARWMRLLHELTLEAKEKGKILGVFGMRSSLQDTAQIIEVKLDLYENLDEIWNAELPEQPEQPEPPEGEENGESQASS